MINLNVVVARIPNVDIEGTAGRTLPVRTVIDYYLRLRSTV